MAHCAEPCGVDHARMNFAVEIVSPEVFDSWLATGDGAGDAPGPDVEDPS